MPARLRRLVAIAAALVVFLLVSGLLARWLATENNERDAELALIRAQAAGDATAMLDRLAGCRTSPACVTSVRALAASLRRPGQVKLLLVESHTAYSLTRATGATRVAWTVIGRLPVVQCVRVRRKGDALGGLSVTLLALSPPIANTGHC